MHCSFLYKKGEKEVNEWMIIMNFDDNLIRVKTIKENVQYKVHTIKSICDTMCITTENYNSLSLSKKNKNPINWGTSWKDFLW